MKAARPNIVIIITDDTGYGDPPCYNPDSLDPMPYVDRMAAEGVRFTNANSPAALCTPARYSLLTGRYYWRTYKKHALVMPYEPTVIESDRTTLPRVLGAAGYGTACVGKWHLGFNYPSRNGGFTQVESEIDFSQPLEGGPCDVGFDYFFGTAGCSTSDAPYCFIENRNTVSIPTRPAPEEFLGLPGFYPGLMADDWDNERADVFHVEKSIQFMDRHKSERPDDPFFLYLGLSSPHNPWTPPNFTQGVSKEGARGDLNVLVDWCVQQVYEALDERGILDDTLIIFTSDHGPMRGENGHRSAGKLRGFKNTAFEGGHRVPFVARWPGHLSPGRIEDELISTADMITTLADLVGVPLSDSALADAEDSFSVVGVLDEERASQETVSPTPSRATGSSPASGSSGRSALRPHLRPALVSDTGGWASKVGDFCIRVGRWKLIVLAEGDDDVYAARRFPITDSVDGRLLFDLENDPYEETNLVASRPELASQLERLLVETKSKGARFVDYTIT